MQELGKESDQRFGLGSDSELASLPPKALAIGTFDLGEIFEEVQELNPYLGRVSLPQLYFTAAARRTELHARHQR